MIRSILLLLFGGSVLFQALRSLRKQRLSERYALVFFFVSIPFLLLAVWPDGIVQLSKLLEIERYTVQVLAMGGFLMLVVFKLTSIVSVQDRRIRTLTQLVAILMEKQNLVERQISEAASKSEPPAAAPQPAEPVQSSGTQAS